jgi:hypothetical protein
MGRILFWVTLQGFVREALKYTQILYYDNWYTGQDLNGRRLECYAELLHIVRKDWLNV